MAIRSKWNTPSRWLGTGLMLLVGCNGSSVETAIAPDSDSKPAVASSVSPATSVTSTPADPTSASDTSSDVSTPLASSSSSSATEADAEPTTTSPLVSVSTTTAAAAAGVEDQVFAWARWGGPDSRMVAPDTYASAGGNARWSEDWQATPPTQRWKVEIGTGFTSFTVAEGRVFTMGRDGDDDVILALDLKTGDVLWSQKLTVPLFDNLHEGGPGATPTLFEDKLITVSRDGQTRCLLQASGEEVWRVNLSELTGIAPPEWGFTTSPWIGKPAGSETTVALFEVGSLVALDASNGNLVWKTEAAQPGYGSPTVFDFEGEQYVATVNNDQMIACRLATGEVVATAPWESRFRTAAATPLIVGDKVFLSSGYGAGCAMFQFKGTSFEQLYANRAMANHMNPCTLIGDTLYGIDGNSDRSRLCRLVAMDWTTGEELWAERGYGCGSVLGCGDRVVVLSDDGVLAIVQASREQYQELARYQVVEGRCWTVPVIVGNLLLARNAAGTVVCLELPEVSAP